MEECERWLEQLSAQMDGELSPGEERELEQHLARCPACRALAEQLAGLSAGLQEMEEVPAPAGFAQGVMKRIAKEKKVVPLLRRPQFQAFAGLAACAALCLGLYGLSGRGQWGQMAGSLQTNGDLSVSAYTAVPDNSLAQGEIVQRDISLFDGTQDGTSSGQAMEGPAVQSAAAGLEHWNVLILDAMPEGADSLLSPDTPVSYSEEYGGEVYSSLTLEQLDALEALAREQGITAARSVEEESSGLCAVVLLSQ